MNTRRRGVACPALCSKTALSLVRTNVRPATAKPLFDVMVFELIRLYVVDLCRGVVYLFLYTAI